MRRRDEDRVWRRVLGVLNDKNASEGTLGRVMHELSERYGKDLLRALFVKRRMNSSRADKLIRMGTTWAALPSADLWAAIGYENCLPFAKAVEDKEQRRVIAREILARRDSSGVVVNDKAVTRQEIEKRVPGAFDKVTVEDEDGDEGQGGEGANAETDAELLVREVRALIEGELPILRSLLSEQALRFVGASSGARRRRRA